MTVSVNQPVSPFKVQATGGEIALSDFAKRTLILYFYPKDSTPGCTNEGIAFRDLYPEFLAANAVVFGVSRDSLASHERFKTKLGFPFELISDPEEVLCKEFDVMKEKKLYGKTYIGVDRSTFVINGTGILAHEWRGVKVSGHVEEVLQYVQGL